MLWGSDRDVSFIKKINEELITDVIDTEVAVYKLIVGQSGKNVYDESGGKNKSYYYPIKISCLIKRDVQQFESDEFGVNYKAAGRFAFLRDTLVEKSLYVEVGDIIEWDNEFHEIDTVEENKYFVGKNTETDLGGNTHGYNVSLICDTHLTNRERLQLVDRRYGDNND